MSRWTMQVDQLRHRVLREARNQSKNGGPQVVLDLATGISDALESLPYDEVDAAIQFLVIVDEELRDLRAGLDG